MNSDALGMIETKEPVGTIEAIDTMVEAANVFLVGYKKVDSGLVAVIVRSGVGAVKAAIDAGATTTRQVGEAVFIHVILRSHSGTEKVIPTIAPKQRLTDFRDKYGRKAPHIDFLFFARMSCQAKWRPEHSRLRKGVVIFVGS